MLKLYRKSQQVQLDWIRNHPAQWVALNVTLALAVTGFIHYKDIKDWREPGETSLFAR